MLLLMRGRSEGLNQLDLSADGFWTSFSAILYALPPLLLSWVVHSGELEAVGSRASIVLRLFVVDCATWILPLVIFIAIAKPIGLWARVVPIVVTLNWSGVVFAWMLLPVDLLRVVLPDQPGVTGLLSSAGVIAILFLMWRMMVITVGRGPAIAGAFLGGMLLLNIFTILLLQPMLGLTLI